jgi:hypothetical protein
MPPDESAQRPARRISDETVGGGAQRRRLGDSQDDATNPLMGPPPPCGRDLFMPAPYGSGEASDDEFPDLTRLATHAGLVLGQRGASLADIYRASAVLMPPCLLRLTDGSREHVHARLWSMLATEQGWPLGLAGLLRREMGFQNAVLDLLGNQTLIVLKDMLHEVIRCAMGHLDQLAADAVVRLTEAPTHHDIVRHLEAGRGQEAAVLAGQRAARVETLLREDEIAGGRLIDLLFDTLG